MSARGPEADIEGRAFEGLYREIIRSVSCIPTQSMIFDTLTFFWERHTKEMSGKRGL